MAVLVDPSGMLESPVHQVNKCAVRVGVRCGAVAAPLIAKGALCVSAGYVGYKCGRQQGRYIEWACDRISSNRGPIPPLDNSDPRHPDHKTETEPKPKPVPVDIEVGTKKKDDEDEVWCHYGPCSTPNPVPSGKWATKSCDLPFDEAITLTILEDMTIRGQPLCQYKCTGIVNWEGNINGTKHIEGRVVRAIQCDKSVVPKK